LTTGVVEEDEHIVYCFVALFLSDGDATPPDPVHAMSVNDQFYLARP